MVRHEEEFVEFFPHLLAAAVSQIPLYVSQIPFVCALTIWAILYGFILSLWNAGYSNLI